MTRAGQFAPVRPVSAAGESRPLLPRRAKIGDAFPGRLLSPARLAAPDITAILEEVGQGDVPAADQLLPLVYGELRKLAAAKMAGEAAGQTLQPTALVHEAWLRLGADEQPDWENRAHFFASAAEAMRRILIDRARRRRAQRHGGDLVRTSADALDRAIAWPGADDAELLDVHEALDALARFDARKAELVKQCYFVGLTLGEAAAVLGISEPTARRDWSYARAWLFDEIRRLRRGGQENISQG
jgi:RNA polymerase sigma factor (TIGR02999 family)